MPRPIRATLSIPAMRHNLATVAAPLLALNQRDGGGRRVWAVIKANAYGHGIENAVQGFQGAHGLAMLDLDEAIRCRDAGWDRPILLLEGIFEPADLPLVERHGLSITVHAVEQLDMLERAAIGAPVDVFLKLDTGMNRLGFSAAAYGTAYRRAQGLQAAGVIGSLGKMTHFARADDDPVRTRAQIALFQQTTRGLPGAVSVCNSAATLTPDIWQSLAEGREQIVRPGICLYGATPFAAISAEALGLQPAMTLESELISVRGIPAGAGVGYGQTFVAPRGMRVGTVACGYADGYPRHAPTGTPVVVQGRRTRVLGRVSMDMLVVDLEPVPEAAVGSPVVLWGEGGPAVDEVAAAAGTIGYELLCAVAPRVPRRLVV